MIVADSLSRATHLNRVLATSYVIPKRIQQVVTGYEQDKYCLDLLAKLSVDPQALLNYTLVNDLLRFKRKLVIGDNTDFKKQLMEIFHTSALGGNSGERSKLKRIHLIFFWPKMQ